jgi:hypothetical protein
MKIITELEKVWDAVPECQKSNTGYCFQCGNDWEEIPETFKGKRIEVFNSWYIGKGKIYYAPKTMITPEELELLEADIPVMTLTTKGDGIECIRLTDDPDCGVVGVTFQK